MIPLAWYWNDLWTRWLCSVVIAVYLMYSAALIVFLPFRIREWMKKSRGEHE